MTVIFWRNGDVGVLAWLVSSDTLYLYSPTQTFLTDRFA